MRTMPGWAFTALAFRPFAAHATRPPAAPAHWPRAARATWPRAAPARWPYARHVAVLLGYQAAGIALTWPRATYLTGRLPDTIDQSGYVWGL
jgi:hypothetical protein